MFVITVDQQNSSATGSRAARRMRELQTQHGDSLQLPVAQFAGDELQLISTDPAAVAHIALEMADDDWHVGIGIGQGTLSATAADSHGRAFQDARSAVNDSKSLPWHIAVRAAATEAAADCEAAFALLQSLRSRRTDAGVEIGRLVDELGSVTAAAEHLGITVSAASKRARIAGLRQEKAGIELLVRLLTRAEAASTASEDHGRVAP